MQKLGYRMRTDVNFNTGVRPKYSEVQTRRMTVRLSRELAVHIFYQQVLSRLQPSRRPNMTTAPLLFGLDEECYATGRSLSGHKLPESRPRSQSMPVIFGSWIDICSIMLSLIFTLLFSRNNSYCSICTYNDVTSYGYMGMRTIILLAS